MTVGRDFKPHDDKHTIIKPLYDIDELLNNAKAT